MGGFTPEFQARLDSFMAAAPGAITINSGYRSPEQQAAIISRSMGKYGFSDSDAAAWRADVEAMGPVDAGQKWGGRFSSSGMRKWIGLPGGSFHQKGMAADLGYASPEVKAWAHENAGQYGLTFPMGHEPWHIEPMGARDGTFAVGTTPGGSNPLKSVETATSAPLSPASGGALEKMAMMNALGMFKPQEQQTYNFLMQG